MTEELQISSTDLELVTPPPPPVIAIDDLGLVAPPPPPVITIDDLLNSTAAIIKKEADDKATLEGIGNIPYETLKSTLLSWTTAGFPNVYEIHRVSISPPSLCSDGVSRDLASYIQFCSGKTINEHVAVLQARVQGMSISFANMGNYISIVVSKQ